MTVMSGSRLVCLEYFPKRAGSEIGQKNMFTYFEYMWSNANYVFQGGNVDEYELPKFNHLLVVFGGVAGIEAALEVSNIQLNFDEAGKDRERERKMDNRGKGGGFFLVARADTLRIE